MRILWVKAGKLLPVDTGGKIRSFNILKHLARWNEVTLLSYYAGPPDDDYQRQLQRLFPKAIAVPARLPGKASLTGRVDYLKGLLSRRPYAVHKHTAAEVKELVFGLLASRSFDVAVCDFLAAADNFPADSGIPVVLFEHNVESILWQRQAGYQRNPIKALVYRVEAAKMLRYEKTAIRSFDHLIAVSENDGHWFRSLVGNSRVSIVPTGVDTEMYTPDSSATPNRNLIAFVGSMDWQANVDGVLHFCRAILPIVHRQIPGARFRIVGRNPGAAVTTLASATVEITGTVDNVIPHLRQAAVVVVPLRIGGGTRLKILESMAMGKAIVSTTIGAEGLNVKDGSEIVLADQPSDFAAAIVRLMRNDRERIALEQNAAALAQNSGWEAAASVFHQALVKVLSSRVAPEACQSEPGAAESDLNGKPRTLKTAESAMG